MYKYQCSRNECGTYWSLEEGCLNGFVLTCPICGKGRGIFVSHEKREGEKGRKPDEIIITVNANLIKTQEELNQKVEELRKNCSLIILSKSMETHGKDIVCTIQYKLKE